MDQHAPYISLAYYHLTILQDPHREVAEHKAFLQTLDARARIYISEQGINGQMTLAASDVQKYTDFLTQKPEFQTCEFKFQPCQEHAFPRLTVKYRKELVALGVEVSIKESDRGAYLTPHEWAKTLESENNKVVLDVRNDYEWKVGHFEGAELFACQTFKQFKDSVTTLKQRLPNKDTKVLMYCTGGIRCELFSALLKKEGIDNVFQLHGGVIQYGEEEKSKHWLGKLFVFDDRLAVDLSDEKAPPIGTCHHCGCTAETYYNCANVDCNELFLCCPACIEKYQGCCKASCMQASRVRPYKFLHKPFRRWYNYKEEESCQVK